DPIALMQMDTFQAILDDFPALPELNRVVFTSFGEPLTHPNILEMIEAVRKKDIAVTLGSNGTVLKPNLVEEIVRLGVDRLVVSVDGVKSETYADLRGANLSVVIENLRKLNDIKRRIGSLYPALGIEFVVLKSNFDELPALASLASRLNASRVIVSNVLPYTEDMIDQIMYGHQPVEPIKAKGFPVRADAWVMWGTMEFPRMHWGAERRCRFVKDQASVIGWDGEVTPCYALSHNYSYYAIDGIKKDVNRYSLGNVKATPLHEIWMSEPYCQFRSEVNIFHFPSCPDCDLRATCELRQNNEGCWGWNPSCADCLWAQDIIRCP
ncbi:MAG: tungsten cofactor oxidoreductase radical SAM maturase, partial [Chloroflexota bacterium]